MTTNSILRSILLANLTTTLIGCGTLLRNYQDPLATKLLEDAGSLIASREYVEARVEFQDAATNGGIQTAALLFGPDELVRVEFGDDYAYYDGVVVGMRGYKRFHHGRHGWFGAGMLVGGVTQGKPCHLGACRYFGKRWWKQFFGKEAKIAHLGEEEVNGTVCDIIKVRSSINDLQATVWIGKVSRCFARFEAGAGPDRTIVIYRDIRFPDPVCVDIFQSGRNRLLSGD